ncbi:copper amine oxidase N-terminal domain-containing protein [Paenibacillus chartarius]|uniref:Copper amine oxidase N-terminal domain-containing protein n=1 Tax=Paenibacillus chartarius TaxID=747481 RepID=A0ABV6DPH4_9BACL
MKKMKIFLAAALLACCLAPASASAKSDGGGRGGSDNSGNSSSSSSDSSGNSSSSSSGGSSSSSSSSSNNNDNDSGNRNKNKNNSSAERSSGDRHSGFETKKQGSEAPKKQDEDHSGNKKNDKLDDGSNRKGRPTVTEDTYGGKGKGQGGGHQGYRGLLNAIDNVKDKPAGAVLAELMLTRYGTNLTEEQKAALADIIAKEEALAKAAELLDKQGSVTEAVYLQKEAIKANVRNVESYKQLGKMYEKLGRKGVKLYVNGEEPAADIAPILRDGTTLVPFRAISESLKASVSWNPDERSVTVTRGDVTVKLIIDSKTAYVNEKPVELEVAPAIENDSTVVPARFVSESLDATVEYEPETQSVVIFEEQK